MWRDCPLLDVTIMIQIPDDLARGLEGIAAAPQKTVEQVAVDSLRSLFDRFVRKICG
jgi:hypothetical protein